MKIYKKNRNFIPDDFIENLKSKSEENNNKLIIVLLIINIFIIPNSVSRLKDTLNNRKTVAAINTNNENKDINKENINHILEMINDKINSISIQNNKGVINFNSIEEVYKIEEENVININSLIFNNKNSYNVEVELWLKKFRYTL